MSIIGTAWDTTKLAWNTVTAPIKGLFSGLGTTGDVVGTLAFPLMAIGGFAGLFFGIPVAIGGAALGLVAAGGIGLAVGSADAVYTTASTIISGPEGSPAPAGGGEEVTAQVTPDARTKEGREVA